MFDSLESYLRHFHNQGVTRHLVTVQQCGAVVSVTAQPAPPTGLRVEFGVDGCRCYPIAWEGDAAPTRIPF